MKIRFRRLSIVLSLLLISGCGKEEELPNEIGGPNSQGSPTGVTGSPTPQDVQIHLPQLADDLPELTATQLTDLKTLRSHGDGEGLVAVARFGPSGTDLPAGTKVTWKLPSPMEVGDRLYIVSLDEAAGTWLDTGELARVVAPGDQAIGLVHHFSVIGISTRQPTTIEENDDRTRYAYINAATVQGTEVIVVEGNKLETVKQIYEDWIRTASADAPMDLEVMRAMYEAGDFDTVKTLIENGAISNKHSLDMADLRTALILETAGRICADKGWKIYRSDSGNQDSGMRSDIDQTIYVYERGADGEWVRAEAMDAEFQKLFAEAFPAHAKMSLADLDVATIAGKDKFPDPRRLSIQIEAEAGRPFSTHAADTMGTLRKTPGAYTYCGAVVQQMQLRAAAAIDKSLRNVGPANKSRQTHERLSALLGENGVNNLVCNAVSAGDDGKLLVHEVSIEEARKVMFDGLAPLLQRGHAYDAAVANYLEYTHHLKDSKPAYKYLLRALDDGVGRLRRLKEGSSATGGEYETLSKSARRDRLEQAIGRYPEMQPMVDRWAVVIDASAELRLKHKKGDLTDEDFKKAFEPLAREIAGPDGDWETKLVEARAEFDRRSQEFMLHNVIATGTQRAFEYVALDLNEASGRHPIERVIDEPKLRASIGMEGKEFDAEWGKVKSEILKNQADLARLQLLYSFREMRPDVVSNIIKYAEIQGMKGADLERLRGLAKESRSMFFGYERYKELKPLYHHIWKKAAKTRVNLALASFRDHILMQAGWTDFDSTNRTGAAGEVALGALKYITGIDTHKINAGMEHFFKTHRAPGVTSRYIRGAVLDVGNLDAGLSVLRTYSETGGDIEATKEAMQREALSSLPIIGQIYNIARSGDVEEGARTAGIMMVCMRVPQAGIAALAYSVLDNSYVIYEHEYSRPLTNKVADALYRGYVGPSLYSYDRAPSEFTGEDKRRLEKIESQDPAGSENEQAKLMIEIRTLREKRAEWESYDGERRKLKSWEGGALFGLSSEYVQRKFEGPTILDQVEPTIFYAPSPLGPVDFTIAPLSQSEEARRKQLEFIAEAKTVEGVAWQDELAELAGLNQRREAYERAQKTLERARVNHELMHQIKRDSIWPWMALKTDEREMLDARAFAKNWCDDHAAAIATALTKLGEDATVSNEAAEEMGTRLLDDLDRSRLLWNARQYAEEQQHLAEVERHERRKAAWFGEAIAQLTLDRPAELLDDSTQASLTGAGANPAVAASLQPLASAIIDRHIPEVVPEIEVWVRKVPVRQPENLVATGEEPTKFEYRPSVKVTADPNIYHPPYRAVAFQLDPDTARQTADSRNFQGLPIDGETAGLLREYAGDWNGQMLIEPMVLTFAFCDGVDIPGRVVRQTVEDLPIPPLVKIPGQDVQAFLLGGTASKPAEQPSEVEVGPVHIKRGYRLSYDAPGYDDYTVVEIAIPKALAKLNSAREDEILGVAIDIAGSADGPWEEFGYGAFYAGTPIVAELPGPKDLPLGNVRSSTSDVRIGIDISSRLKGRGVDLPGPWYLRARQCWFKYADDGSQNMLTEETVSNVWTSKQGKIFGGYDDGDGPPAKNLMGSINVRMGLAEQDYDIRNASFKLSVGGWTGHFYDGLILFPWDPHGTTVSVTATAGEVTATETFNIKGKELAAFEAWQQTEIANAEAEFSRISTANNAKIAEMKGQLDEVKTRVAKVDSIPADWDAAHAFVGEKMQIVALENWIAIYENIYQKAAAEYRDRQIAVANRNWSQALALTQSRIGINEADLNAKLENIAEVAEARAELNSHPSVPDGWVDGMILRQQAEEKQLKEFLASVMTIQNEHTLLFEYAYFAGQAGELEAGIRKLVEIRQAEAANSADGRVFVPEMRDVAFKLVTLTGSGAKGAALLREQAQLSGAKPPWEDGRGAPPWWPAN